jgi:hypothetical protein
LIQRFAKDEVVAMNFMDPILPKQREAQLKYLDGEYQVMKQGDFVRCGITKDPISIENLRYWNVAKQIAYKSVEVAFEGMYGAK